MKLYLIETSIPSCHCESVPDLIGDLGTKQSRARKVFLGKVARRLKHKISSDDGIIKKTQNTLGRTI